MKRNATLVYYCMHQYTYSHMYSRVVRVILVCTSESLFRKVHLHIHIPTRYVHHLSKQCPSLLEIGLI